MSDSESKEDGDLANFASESLLMPMPENIVVSHPGITRSKFINHFQVGYLPLEFRTIIRNLEDNEDNSEDIIKLWNDVNDFVPQTFDDLVALYKLSCGLMLLPSTIEMTHLKLGVIHKVFRHTSHDWDVNPVMIHVISKELYPFLVDSRNLMYFIRIIAVVSRMAFYVSCCLAWSLFFRILDKEVKMYRLHDLQTMVDALKDDLDLKKMEENTSDFYSLLDAMAFLINVIVFRKSEEMICERYNDNFVSTRDQIDVLYQWGSNILDTFQPHNVENQDPILIAELVRFDIVDPLRGFLEDTDIPT